MHVEVGKEIQFVSNRPSSLFQRVSNMTRFCVDKI